VALIVITDLAAAAPEADPNAGPNADPDADPFFFFPFFGFRRRFFWG